MKPALEIGVILCGILTLLHAWRRGRLFDWIAVLSYGVAMEILSYHAFDNFHHARFSVMLYGGRMPLYVVWVYPVLIYTAIQAVSRLGLQRAVEPFAAGLAIVLLDMPFDILGVDGDWWFWSATDPNLSARWLGVPVTSYYWHLAFGGCLAFLVRWLRGRSIALAPLAGVLTIPLGVAAFIPFHLLKRLGTPDGAIVALLVAVSASLLVLGRKAARPAADRLLLAVPLAYHALLVVVAARFFSDGRTPTPQLAVIAAATAISLGLHAATQRAAA
jgi:hypothetical protein